LGRSSGLPSSFFVAFPCDALHSGVVTKSSGLQQRGAAPEWLECAYTQRHRLPVSPRFKDSIRAPKNFLDSKPDFLEKASFFWAAVFFFIFVLNWQARPQKQRNRSQGIAEPKGGNTTVGLTIIFFAFEKNFRVWVGLLLSALAPKQARLVESIKGTSAQMEPKLV
jgi:hypothetical protein